MDLVLERFPADESLRAWDAADEYLLRHLAETGVSGEVVIVGDRWGALATELAAHRPSQISDSFLAQAATRANLEANGRSGVTLLTSRDTPPPRIDVLLVRVPKSLALLEDQLHRLSPGVHAGTRIVGTGMVKEIHTSTLALFERILGPTRTSPAVKKARLILTTADASIPRTPGPWPLTYRLPADAAIVAGRPVVNHAGVFCADRLDIGTRFLLENLPTMPDASTIVDLGCGNGVVGLAAALTHPGAGVLFTDESFQAVASAEATYRANLEGRPGLAGKAEFRAADALTGLEKGSVDLVLSNPPFHTHQATTDAIAWRMFTGARDALRPGGELWVVANRHLGHHTRLRRVFGNCSLVASNPKFVVLRAVRRQRRR
ncbi:methyltransferase [Actinocorallia longicatena]|uniref:Methyltransferase n=1 Tax=Actinocorallia longicatena TaxID=111803 RepID=A0ABP6QEA7_9ACTN